MDREREIRERGREVEVSSRARELLREVERFRIINPKDLLKYRYGGAERDMRLDIDGLIGRKLLHRHVVMDLKQSRRLEVLTLTNKDGSAPKLQKPREVYHDAQIYELYQRAAAKLAAQGATIGRVMTDHELKGAKARAWNRRSPGRESNMQPELAERERIAASLHLKLVDGKMPIPDVQIQYRDRDGADQVLNLEVVTESYRGRDTGPKRQAGFAMARTSNHTGRARAIIYDDHSIWK